MKTLIIKILLLSQCILAQKSAESEWQLRKLENGVSVYTKDLENSAIKELKSVFQVKASLATIVALLNDSEAFPKWAYRCGECSTIKKISDSEFIRYQTVVAPWPVDDRDFTVNVKVTQNPLTKVVVQDVTVLQNVSALRNDFVRIIIFKGKWTLSPLKNGFVNVEYQLLVDPGGNIPAWLVNMSAIDGPIENASAMKVWLVKEKYLKASLWYIREL